VASTIGAAASLVPAKSRAGIASISPTWAAATVSTTTELSATDAISAELSAAVGATAKPKTSKEPPLAHSCHRRRLTRLSLRCLLCVGGCAAQGIDDNSDDKRAGRHTAGNGECDTHCACNSRTYSDSNAKINVYTNAHTITNPDTSANTDHCSAGSAYTEAETNANTCM
jgi:hypothetical protein